MKYGWEEAGLARHAVIVCQVSRSQFGLIFVMIHLTSRFTGIPRDVHCNTIALLHCF